MPDQPLRDLTPGEIEAFQNDGVVCARGVFPQSWVERMGSALDRIVAKPTAYGEIVSMQDKGFTNDLFVWLTDDDFRAFVFESAAAPLACQVLGSSAVTFFYDQVFVKETGANVPTPWHHDLTFWPVEGDRICSIWMPFDEVTRESSGLEYVRGSHRWGKRFKAVSPDYNEYLLESDLEDPPDIEANRSDYDLLSWDMSPGDALIFHPLVLHGSSGNSSATHRRRALATRWLGDDVVYEPRPATMPLPFAHDLAPGSPLSGDSFPLIAAS